MSTRAEVAIVSATVPRPPDNGKRVVLSGLIDYFSERYGNGATHYILVADPATPPVELPCRMHLIAKPRTLEQVRSVTRRVAMGGSTLQEALLYSPQVARALHDLVDRIDPRVTIYDTLRLGQYARHDRNEVVYLDDLFSVRYQRMLDADARGELGDIDPLGEFGANIPPVLRALVRQRAVYRPLLRLERRRIERREVDVARAFTTSLLLNDREVQQLRARALTESVRLMLPYLPEVSATPRALLPKPQFVFLGRLNVPHNDGAITSFLREAAPAIARELPDAAVRIIGRGATRSLQRVAADHPELISIEGYVPDLEEAFASSTAMLAPLRYGTGVKVKVLESIARALPVLGTARAFSGIPVATDGSSGCIVEDDFAKWPRIMHALTEPQYNARLSRAARDFYSTTYRRDVVAGHYAAVFDEAHPSHASRTYARPRTLA
jgi:glycosyltransferase involved in cell wall biosynthesis